ncbi:MAG: hypothetical protein EPN20_00225, partial [Magnetospirillum sp.]
MTTRTPDATIAAPDGILATASAVALPDGATPEWVKLFGYGAVTGRDGRGPYTVRDQAHAVQIIAATTARQSGADAPVDYDHQTQRSETNGLPAPAAGWIKSFEVRPDGIYAKAEWTAKAAQHLGNKEYRYISPTFIHDKAGTVLRIVGAGLTNLPNLEIPAIANQTPGAIMDPELLIKQIRAALGLSDTVSGESLVTHCQQLTTGAKAVAKLLGLADSTTPDQLATAAQTSFAALAVTLKQATDATMPILATAAQQLVAGADKASAVDLTKYVPMDIYLATAGQLARSGEGAVTRAVDDAMAAGKITPATKDHWLAVASQNLAGFADLMGKMPVIIAT